MDKLTLLLASSCVVGVLAFELFLRRYVKILRLAIRLQAPPISKLSKLSSAHRGNPQSTDNLLFLPPIQQVLRPVLGQNAYDLFAYGLFAYSSLQFL